MALAIIEGYKDTGFMVYFHHLHDGKLYPDWFPDIDNGEHFIQTESEAWELARKFATHSIGKFVDIFVVDQNFEPVPGHEMLRIDNRKL